MFRRSSANLDLATRGCSHRPPMARTSTSPTLARREPRRADGVVPPSGAVLALLLCALVAAGTAAGATPDPEDVEAPVEKDPLEEHGNQELDPDGVPLTVSTRWDDEARGVEVEGLEGPNRKVHAAAYDRGDEATAHAGFMTPPDDLDTTGHAEAAASEEGVSVEAGSWQQGHPMQPSAGLSPDRASAGMDWFPVRGHVIVDLTHPVGEVPDPPGVAVVDVELFVYSTDLGLGLGVDRRDHVVASEYCAEVEGVGDCVPAWALVQGLPRPGLP